MIAISVLVLLLVAIGGLGLYGIGKSNDVRDTVYDDRVIPLVDLATINDKWQLVRFNSIVAANSDDRGVARDITLNSDSLLQEIQKLWSKFSVTVLTSEERFLAETYTGQVAAYEAAHARIMLVASDGDFEGALENSQNDAESKFNAMNDTLLRLIKLQRTVANEEFAEADSVQGTILIITILILIAGIGAAAYFVRLLLRAIIEPLDELNVRASITDMTCIVSDANLKGDILSVNDKYIEVSKYSRNELIGQPHSITRHPDMPKSVFKKVWSTIGRGGVFRGVIKNLAKNGEPYYVDATIAPVLGSNGKPRKYIGVRYDITEAELERQNMKGIVDAINSAYGYIEFDTEGNILAANPNFLQLMGYQLDEVVGKHHRIFAEPGFANSASYTQFWDDLRSGKHVTGTFHRVTKSGGGVWIQATYSPVKDETGRVFKVIKIATDVTKEKLEIVGQLDAIGKAQAMAEFSMDGVILNANENFLNMFGYTYNELCGQNYSSLLDPAERNSSKSQAVWAKLQQGGFDAGQHKYAAKGGGILWIQTFHSALVDLNNKPFKAIMYATEITDQIIASQMLEAAVVQTRDVISSAKDGNLVERVPIEGKDGEIADLCSSVNSLLDTTDKVMSEVGRVLEALAKGNLNEKIDNSYQGSFGKLSSDVNLTTKNLLDIVGSISKSANIISVTSGEIAAGNSDLSARTEKQAASLEETAASIEEMTSTVKQNADNAQQANQLAIGASGVAEKGGEVVNQVVVTMSSINDSSKKIVDIIGVIDGIAFQTNILALNAAVEAARAGEQGRGFAVVATEVRNLAQRSAAAAKEIKTLIGDSVNKVADGTKLVDEAGETMLEIVNSIKHVTDIMGEITAASREQSIGIQQVNDAIAQVDEVTQQNAALVEQSAAAAEEMQIQARQLTDAISAFDLSAVSSAGVASDTSEHRPARTRSLADSRPSSGRKAIAVKSLPNKSSTSAANSRVTSNQEGSEWSEF